jgi:hypothetical protein
MLRQAMRIFLALWCALATTIIVDMLIYNVFGSIGFRYDIGINIRGNLVFMVILAIACTIIKSIEIISYKSVAGIVGFIVSCIALGSAIPSVISHSPFLGLLMTAPFGVIGTYPGGADVPFSHGAKIWAISAIVPIAIGLLLAAIVRKFVRREATDRGTN